MGDKLKSLRERSQKRRELLAQQLGLESADELKRELKIQTEVTKASTSSESSSKQLDLKSVPNEGSSADSEPEKKRQKPSDDPQSPTEDFPEEEIYRDSSTFLKGTQSANPHNDYCQHFVDTGQRPQNFIRDVGLADRFEEYPKLKELIKLKDELISEKATAPMYLKCDLLNYNLKDLDCKFDVILVEPPLEEYQRTAGVTNTKLWSWEDIMNLNIGEVAAQRSFLFLMCGSSDGLDFGRQCLKQWGFRRCEDICWIKTNIKNAGTHSGNLEQHAVFQRTKEHCLMGIKGTVRRSTDGDFIHANVDIDLIISEEPEYGSIEKPIEIFHMIERFCLGRRRLHLFGLDTTIRPGWLTVGPDLTNSNFNSELFNSYFNQNPEGYLTGCTDRIEALRPKSPPPKKGSGSMARGGSRNWSGRSGRGRGHRNR